MKSQLKIDKNLFDPRQFDDVLTSYFSEFNFSYNVDDKHIIIDLCPSDYAYCEDLHPGLQALHIQDSNIKDFCYIDNYSGLCLSENWIPFIWCSIQEKLRKNEFVKIIHVDDHADLMSPFIRYKNGKYINMIDGSIVRLNDKDSLKRAIESGAITIGSQLTMITYMIEKFSIFHVKRDSNRESLSVCKELISDGVLSKCSDRISLSYLNDTNISNRYFRTDNPEDLFELIDATDKCILHIDMDYFANRYNGSTSWKEDNLSRDLGFAAQKVYMNRLCDAISAINRKNRIIYTIIGLSPSFYPSEYWKDGLCYLLDGLSKAGCNVDGMKKRFCEDMN